MRTPIGWVRAGFTAAMLAVSMAPGWAQEVAREKPGTTVPFTVRLEMQVVSVPVPVALRLVPEFLDAKTAPQAFERVQTMLAQDQANLVGNSILWLKSGSGDANPETRGRSGKSAAFDEVRYATEGMPPSSPGGSFAGPSYDAFWGPAWLTAFETREAGVTLEADATVLDPQGRAVLVTVVAQQVRLVRFDQITIQPSPVGGTGLWTNPNFQTSRVTTSITLANGQPALIGHFIIRDPQPHAELFLLRARTIALAKDVEFAPPTPLKK